MKPLLLDLPMPIITPRLILRPPQVGEGIILNEAILESFDLLNQFMPWAKEKPSIDDSEVFVRQAASNWILKNNDEPYLPLFLFDRKTNQFIGTTGYHHYDWDIPSIETGYWLRKSHTGKGYMTEAINAITQYAFKQLGVKRISISCDINNVRSKKIPERLEFTLEGTLKSHRRNSSTMRISDTLLYSKCDLSGLTDLIVIWGNKHE